MFLDNGMHAQRQDRDVYLVLLPTGSEEREIFWMGSIPVAILPSCQYVENIAL